MVKKFRILTIALIFSVALNVALLSAFAFCNVEQIPVAQMIGRSTAPEPENLTNMAAFQAMSKLTFRELVSFLTNKERIEEGITKRDLALAALTAFHHFNLEKALSAPVAQVRKFHFSPTETVELFPGLTEEQFQAIIRYAYQEKWPLTAKGLFTLLQHPHDESLEQAFLVTTEFHALQTLFQKTAVPQKIETLLSLIIEGTWDLLDRFTKGQAQILDFSIDKRRELLLSYLSCRSTVAAELLLKTDYNFALKRLEDQGICDLLALLKPSEETSRFCAELLRSPRSDAVLQKAAAFIGEKPPLALPQEPPARYHTVQDGESLWKISRQYKVKVDEIVKLNDLQKESVYPGMTLKIP